MWFRKKKLLQEQQFTTLQSAVEFTLLDSRATQKDIHDLVNVAIKNKYHGVCVNGANVKIAKEFALTKATYNLAVVCVVGFPLGANTIQTKVFEAKQAIADGADEIDVVINIGKAQEGDFEYIKNELSRIVRACHGKIVKAIIETCYLSRDQIVQLCRVCMRAKVDFVKTSTGFGTGGATPEVVSLISNTCGGKCGVKASGGIRTTRQAEDMIRAGATRIGTSTEI